MASLPSLSPCGPTNPSSDLSTNSKPHHHHSARPDSRTRTKRPFRAHLSRNSYPGLKPWAKFYCPLRGKDDLPFRTITSALTTKRYIKKLHNDSRRWTAATRLRL